MATAPPRSCALVYEGPDDFAALRDLLRADHSADVPGTRWGQKSEATTPTAVLQLYRADGKRAKLAERTRDALQGTASVRPDFVAVSFDPDGDPVEREVEFLRKDLQTRCAVDPSFVLSLEAGTWAADVTFDGRPVRLLAAGWRVESPLPFDGLSDENDLERVLVTGALRSLAETDARRTWAEEAIDNLRALAADHGWKRAFRLWNAALAPVSESFVEKLLKMDETRVGCLEALRATPVARMVATLLAPGPAPPPAGPAAPGPASAPAPPRSDADA